MVYRFNRLARSTRELVVAVEEFKELGIQFISLYEQIVTTLPSGKLAFVIFSAVAEFEREQSKSACDRGSQKPKLRAKGSVGHRPMPH